MENKQDSRVIKARLIARGAQRLDSEQRRAFADAERIRQEAEDQRATAREQGYSEGLAEGRAALAAEAIALRAEAARLRNSAGERLIKLGIGLAERILAVELETSPAAIDALACQTLRETPWYPTLTLRLHPNDATGLEDALPRLSGLLAPDTALSIVEDPTLAPGSCVVETPAGELDGSIPVRLAALEAALRDQEDEHA